jgi:hypothetical protein
VSHRLQATIVLALLGTGCATTYSPGGNRVVDMTGEDGEIAFTNRCNTYPRGLFGHGLVEAVGDHPQARSSASAYVRDQIFGTVAAVVGVGAVTVEVFSAADSSGWPHTSDYAGLAVALVGVIAAGVLDVSSQGHLREAIDTYDAAFPEPFDRRARCPEGP